MKTDYKTGHLIANPEIINKNFKKLVDKIEELESRLEKLENRNTPTGNDYFDEIRRQIEEGCYF
ncbi:MAG: hypothetical protein IKY94_15840 [Lachnospiraceae bacterium]|jgi:uncharacterized protein YdcH (DUF465 family)|nr:hypothetical protein [Lachnospiraceae bacterium]